MSLRANVEKKVLLFKNFKSLKFIQDISKFYKIGKVLGKGSFGEVCSCTHQYSGKEYAIKTVQKSKINEHKVLLDLMAQELDVLAATDHPHITRIHELIEDDGNFYIVSELVTGGELYNKIIEKKKFSEKEAALCINQIALALNYMHKQNIIHRDIKPENILIEQNHDNQIKCKLTDFGFATWFNRDKGLTQVLGSPLYMAPEIVQEMQYSDKVDVWAVGVICHILLTGCPPFFARNKPAIFRAIVNEVPSFGG